MSSQRVENFKNYQNLSSKLRTILIDKLQVVDRCRLAGCSKQCRKEAKLSKNYMYELKLHISPHQIYIIICYGAYDLLDNTRQGICLRFGEENGRKIVECRSLRRRKLWANNLSDSTDLVQLAIQKFKNMLIKNQKIIKKLSIHLSHPQQFNFDEISNFENLEKLTIFDDCIDARQILSKIPQNLKCLVIFGRRNGEFLKDCRQTYQVGEYLHSPNTILTNQQFLQLSACHVIINIGNLTEQNIFDFIKSWKISTQIAINRCQWNLKYSKFDIAKFFRFFGVNYEGTPTKIHDVQHQFQAEKWAELYYSNFGKGQNVERILSFRVYQRFIV